jgi:hypothetical protein
VSELIDEDEEYEVKEILEKWCWKSKLWYKIKWKTTLLSIINEFRSKTWVKLKICVRSLMSINEREIKIDCS